MELHDFLLARIAEDEAVARKQGQPWSHEWRADGRRVRAGGSHDARVGEGSVQSAEHFARWDPARVLAECEAKRRIVTASWSDMREAVYDTDLTLDTWIETQAHTLRLLALPYADHPDYREEWRP